MRLGVMWNSTFRLHLRAITEPSRIVLRSVKWNEGQPLQRLFSATGKTKSEPKSWQLIQKPASPLPCLHQLHRLFLLLALQATYFSVINWYWRFIQSLSNQDTWFDFFFLPLWWHLKGNWMKQLFCSVNALGTSVSQCIRELSTIKHLTEQPYYFHLSKGVLALPSHWTSNAFS